MSQLHNQHLLWRAGFGPSAEQLAVLGTARPKSLFAALQKASSQPPAYLNEADNALQGLVMGVDAAIKAKEMDSATKKMVRQKQRDSIRNLNLAWMREMLTSPAQLREKMAFFWHGHFASRNGNVFYQQELLHLLRTHALGSFRTLLHEVAKSAAILNFLNAAQNRKGHPNENFAREVMELFTLGRGHYTEQDVKEAARAFTGWTASVPGEFVFRAKQHDSGPKTILGKSNIYSGEEVLDLLLAQEQTAAFLVSKICRFFVGDDVDAGIQAGLAKQFYKSDYNIGALMEAIFTSDWFYQPKYIGSRIKSPVELIVGIQRILPMTLDKEEAMLQVQQVLGQVLFNPPNVAGWPGGRAWIDASTLTARMRLPLLLTARDEWNLQAKSDDDQQMGKSTAAMGQMGKQLQADINWKPLVTLFEKVPRPKLNATVAGYLLQTKGRPSDALLGAYTDSSSREVYIATLITWLMASPEYQLC